MPVDNKEKGVKTVQTMLAAKKPVNNQSSKENPAKRDKRTHSDVSEESLENIDVMTIHSDLVDIKRSLQATVTKSDLNSAIEDLVKQKDLKHLVTEIVKQSLDVFKETITKTLENTLREKTGKLQDQIDSLYIENENLKESIRGKDKTIKELEERVVDCERRSTDALKLGNYNKQYSRKHNIRMVNYPERRGENLREDFVNLVQSELKVDIDHNDVLAIHRIPGKAGEVKPVLVKMRNTEVKINVMRNKKGLKNGVKFHDDITQRNLGLITRLKKYEELENVWFHNCSVYGKPPEGNKIKFDIFDNFEEKIKKKR